MGIEDEDLKGIRRMVAIGCDLSNAVVRALIDRLDRAKGRPPFDWSAAPQPLGVIDERGHLVEGFSVAGEAD